ncbi:SDR family oxidoreductase [Bacillus sp. 1P06AnD]|uniref:SDR family oxidoreductase n=1 Tax=Bacillus sp. 1P06AnD TaxID=3132208 RepID=UPI0039A1997B
MDKRMGKVALVTGVSRENGIGAAVCRALAQKGVSLFFTHLYGYDAKTGYSHIEENWPEDFKRELSRYGIRAESMELDLSERDSIPRLLEHAESRFGKLDILVNNATHCEEVGYQQMTADILLKHCEVNIVGTCLLSVEFAKRAGKGKEGRIINLVSGQDKSPQPGNLAYITTKGAISAFTKSLAVELAAEKITVNAVDPGPTDTGWMDEATKQFLRPKFPTGAIGSPEDAARLISFLASEEAGWVTGQIIHSDGGFRD